MKKYISILIILFLCFPINAGIFEGVGKILGIETNDNSEKILDSIKKTASITNYLVI